MTAIFDRIRHFLFPIDTRASDEKKTLLVQAGERALNVDGQARNLMELWKQQQRTEELRRQRITGNLVEGYFYPPDVRGTHDE